MKRFLAASFGGIVPAFRPSRSTCVDFFGSASIAFHLANSAHGHQNTKKPALMKTKSTSRSAFFISRLLIGFALYSVGLLLALAGWSKSVVATTAPAQTLGSWTATGSLTTARFSHTETLLPNGKVLVAGGTDSNFFSFASAELYDPATGLWTATGSMATARLVHTATLLPNGQVLVAAGIATYSDYLASAELYVSDRGAANSRR